MMAQEDFKQYKNPASVTGYKIEGDSGRLHWGYGFTDMLRRERAIERIGTIKRVIVTEERVSPNRWTDGSEHPEVTCWALVELDNDRIVEVQGRVFKWVLDPAIYEGPKKGKA